MSQTNLKLTHQEAVVKAWGDTFTETIVLADLVAVGQVATMGGQAVNIVGVTWTGDATSTFTVSRDSEVILTLPCSQAGNSIDFSGQQLPPENVLNTNDIVVTLDAGVGQIYLKLRKVDGYVTSVEPEQFGPYDDPEAVGS